MLPEKFRINFLCLVLHSVALECLNLILILMETGWSPWVSIQYELIVESMPPAAGQCCSFVGSVERILETGQMWRKLVMLSWCN